MLTPVHLFFADKNGEVTGDSEFPRVFLLMHKWFMESDELFVRLRDLYATCEDSQTEQQSKICHAYQ